MFSIALQCFCGDVSQQQRHEQLGPLGSELPTYSAFRLKKYFDRRIVLVVYWPSAVLANNRILYPLLVLYAQPWLLNRCVELRLKQLSDLVSTVSFS